MEDNVSLINLLSWEGGAEDVVFLNLLFFKTLCLNFNQTRHNQCFINVWIAVSAFINQYIHKANVITIISIFLKIIIISM